MKISEVREAIRDKPVKVEKADNCYVFTTDQGEWIGALTVRETTVPVLMALLEGLT